MQQEIRSKRLVSYQSKSFIKRRREKNIWVGVLSVAVVILLGFSIVKILGSQFLAINTVEVHGTDPEIVDRLRVKVASALEGKYFGFLPRSNIIFYPRHSILASAFATSPKIENMEISRGGKNSIVLRIIEKSASAIVCATYPDFHGGRLNFSDSKSCALADESGFLYELTDSDTAVDYNRYYAPILASFETSDDFPVGIYATSTEEFANLQEVYDLLKSNGIKTEGILIKDGGEYEAYIRNPGVALDQSDHKELDRNVSITVVYFNNQRPLTVQLSNLLLFWVHAGEDSRSKGRILEFDYIDVRYGSNVFFRESQTE